MAAYLPLIKFVISHSFYIDGVCRDIEMQFSNACKKTIANYGLILRKESGNQYVLYIKSSPELPELPGAFEKELNADNNLLVFTIKTTHQRFFCYTDELPNLSKNQRSVYEIDIRGKDSIENKINQIDIKQLSPETREHFDSPNILGIIQLIITSGNSSIFEDVIAQKKPIDIVIDFEPKTAFWKYILLPRSTSESELKISDSSNEIEFSDIEWTSFNKQEKAGVSQSLQKIRLSEEYPYHIQLWKNYNNGKRIILDRLAMPNVENPESFSVDSEMNNYITIYQYF